MRIVVALGGNALLRRGEPMTAENQRRNVRRAATAIEPLADGHELIVTHGNGPQVGLLALQAAAYDARASQPLDVLDAESEGMIGYLIEQELRNRLPANRRCVTLLTQTEVAADDPAFASPNKPIGPVYREDEAARLVAEHGWRIARDGDGWRRVVASPRPARILESDVIELLVEKDVIVICAGGGGIPAIRNRDGMLAGIDAVIDKDLTSALLAENLQADALLMLTDVDAVYANWGRPDERPIRRFAPTALAQSSFEPGTMGPKVAAACEFVTRTGGTAAIGALDQAREVLEGTAGTRITTDIGLADIEHARCEE